MHFYMVLEEVNKDMFVRLVGPKTSLLFSQMIDSIEPVCQFIDPISTLVRNFNARFARSHILYYT